jgi:hypothetical protein
MKSGQGCFHFFFWKKWTEVCFVIQRTKYSNADNRWLVVVAQPNVTPGSRLDEDVNTSDSGSAHAMIRVYGDKERRGDSSPPTSNTIPECNIRHVRLDANTAAHLLARRLSTPECVRRQVDVEGRVIPKIVTQLINESLP